MLRSFESINPFLIKSSEHRYHPPCHAVLRARMPPAPGFYLALVQMDTPVHYWKVLHLVTRCSDLVSVSLYL